MNTQITRRKVLTTKSDGMIMLEKGVLHEATYVLRLTPSAVQESLILMRQ